MKRWIDKQWIVPYILVILGLIAASFYDYQIDAFLYDPGNLFGIFFERIILFPIEMMVPICFFALYRIYKEKRYLLCYMISCCYVVYDIAHYWISVSSVLWYVVVIMIVINLLTFVILRKVSVHSWRKHERFIWFILAVFLSALIITFTIKQCWGRVRFREMLTDSSQFTQWYLPQVFSGHHSFPSGHTTVMSVCLCSLYYYKDHEPLREVSWGIKCCVLLLILAMMISRMIMGAHFLSDVLGGFTVTYTMVQVWSRRFFRRGV